MREHDPVLFLLMRNWPAVFTPEQPQPLAIGIHLDILKALGDTVTADELSRTLDRYVNSELYLSACTQRGAKRIYLDSTPAGTVTDDEQNYARYQLDERWRTREGERLLRQRYGGLRYGGRL